MYDQLLDSPATSADTLPLRGRIEEVDADRVRVRLSSGSLEHAWAEAAVPYPLEVGREVLLTRDAEQNWYVIGVLGAVRATAGATTRIVGTEADQRIQILNQAREVVFEYLPASGKLRIAAEGDLELTAPQGAIRLTAQQVDLAASQQVRLAVPGSAGAGSLLQLDGRQLRATSDQLNLSARECTADLGHARLAGESLAVETTRLRIAADAIETLARVCTETLGDVYRTVRGLYEQQLHRWRTTVTASCYIKAEQMTLKTDQDFKVHGDSIQLG